MASLHPFRALRPAPRAAATVSSVPYDVVSTEEARELAATNPLSFLHVTRSEIDLPPDTDPYSARGVRAGARELRCAARAARRWCMEDAPSLYFYRLRMGAHEQTGVAGCFSVDEYEHDVIKKHERTRRDKEDDRTRHMVELRAQTGVVFLTYRAAPDVDAIGGRVTAASRSTTSPRPTACSTRSGARAPTRRASWSLRSRRIPALYIADGHHRAASAARARAELLGGTGAGASAGADTFIAVAFPHNQVQILPYNRTVKDLAGRRPRQFLERPAQAVPMSPTAGAAPRARAKCRCISAGRWYTFDLVGAAAGGRSRASGLDVALLQQHVLERMLGIGDIRTDKRIDFVGGARGTPALEQAVDSGKAAVAFSMYPVTVDDLMAISDAGGIMPPEVDVVRAEAARRAARTSSSDVSRR